MTDKGDLGLIATRTASGMRVLPRCRSDQALVVWTSYSDRGNAGNTPFGSLVIATGSTVPRRGLIMRRSRVLSLLGSAALVGGLLLTVAGAPPAEATSITVNTELDPPANPQTGHFPTDGKCSLRAAIQSAQNNSNANDVDCATGLGNNVLDSIHIDASLTGKTLTMTAGKPFDIVYGPTNPMEIIGPTTNSADFAISGNNATRIFEFGYTGFGNTDNRAVVKLANLTVKGGNGVGDSSGGFYPNGDGGAAVLGDGTQLTLDNVVFRDNNVSGSARGGAIWANQATITNNGGAYINNHANGNGGTGAGGGRGGAIAFFNQASTLNGYAVLMEGNTATYAGGALAAMNGNDRTVFHLERGLLKDNSAKVGGVYWTENTAAGPAFEMQDSTATGNSSTQGGGVFFAASTLQSFNFRRDTFVGNTGPGGLFWANAGTVVNSIVKDSPCHNTSSGNFTAAGNLSGGDTSGCTFGLGAAVTGLAAALAQNGGPEVQRTFRLSAGSNAIDTGSQTYCGTIDARSLPRGTDGNGILNNPVAGDCDVGAYEYVKYVVNFVTGTSSVLEGAATNVQVKLTIPDPADRPLPQAVTVPVTRDQSSTARAAIDYTVPPAGVTFPSGSGSAGTATVNYPVTILQDNVAERFGEQVLFHLGQAPGVAIAEPKDHHLTIQDDDQAGILKSDGGNGTTVSEAAVGITDSLSISLRSQPDYSQPDPNDSNSYGPPADVTATVVPDRDCTISVSNSTAAAGGGRSFTILNADWQTQRTITVTAVDDLYDEDMRDESAVHKCELRFSFASSDPVYNATQDAYEVNVVDNDVAGVTISKTTATLVEGGATDIYTFKLDTPPDPGKPLPNVPRAATTITVDPDAQCDVGLGAGVPKTLSFTEANYSTAQTVTLTAFDDPTVELAHSCVVTHTVGGGDPVYTNLSAPPAFAKTPTGMTGAIQDYDPPTITNDPPRVNIITGTGVHVSEATAGTFDTFDVVLERQPLTQSVVVDLAVSSDPSIPQPQLTPQKAPPAAIVAPSSTLQVTFTAANWNTAQTVRVYAGNDDYDEASPYGVPAYIRATLSSSAVGFSSATLRQFKLDAATPVLNTVDIPVVVDDDDVSSVVLSQHAAVLAVSEGGGTDAYTVQLGSHPYGDVTVSVQSTSQCTVNGQPAGGAAVLTFPAATWSTPQTVTVAAVDDALIEVGSQTCTITHGAASGGDVLYDGLAGPNASATVTDNDFPRVLMTTGGGVVLDEANSATTDSYAVVLQAQPDADVTVNVAVTDGQTLVSTGAGAPSPALGLLFTPANWSTVQTVQVRPVNDAIDEASPHAGAIGHSVTSTATGFATVPEFWVDGAPGSTVPVSISDDDTAGITVTESGGSTSVGEGTGTDTVSYVLASQPTADVTLTPTIAPRCSSTPATLTFTAADWAVPQSVTVSSPANDAVEPPVTCALLTTAASTDALYSGANIAPVSVAVVEDDQPTVLITGAPLTLGEAGAADSYSVVLGAKPTAPVHVIASVVDGQSTLTGGLTTLDLLFTDADWNVPQTVSVQAVDDATHEGPHNGAIGHSITSAAFGYATTPLLSVDGVPGSAVASAITDNDGSDIAVTVLDTSPPVVTGTHVWSVTASNLTADPAATGVVVSVTVPDGSQFSAADSAAGWTCPAGTGAGKVCTLAVGSLSQAAPAVALFGVHVTGPFAAGVNTLAMTASVADDGTAGPDPVPASNAFTVISPLDVAPDLAVTVTAPAQVITGGVATYTVSWTNTGAQDATGAFIAVPVPAGTTFHKTGSDAAWSCADGAVAGTVCTAAVSGASGGSGALKFLVNVPAAAGATVAVVATIADDGTNGVDPTPANDSGSVSSTVSLPPPPPPPPASPSPAPTTTASAPPVVGGTSAPGLGGPAPSGGPGEPPTSPAPPCPAETVCAPPTMSFDSDEITAGGVVHVTGTARPGALVTLLGYSRPSTTYQVLRSGVADDAGQWAFTLAPTTNSRLFARSVDGSSPSAVVLVRSVVSLTTVTAPGCTLIAKGSVYPHRSRVRVDIQYRASDGRWIPAMAVATGPGGLYSVGRAFGACGSSLTWRAVTRTTVVNTAAASPLRTATLIP
jgi:uncharacterized repeat protein (TIGR01451 family)